MASKITGHAASGQAGPAAFRFSDYWPEGFLAWRATLLWGALYTVAAIVLLLCARGEQLFFVKRALATMMGFSHPEYLDTACLDWAVTAVLLGLVAVAGIVDISLGLAVVILARPWHDGYTFPGGNVYFLWAIGILYALWGFRLLRRGEEAHFPRLSLVLLGFLGVAAVTAFTGICYDHSLRRLVLWAAYWLLFVLGLNGTRGPARTAVVLGGLMLSAGLESAYSLIHFQMVLPVMRKLIQDPAWLQEYFHTNTVTPELARRFNLNRAFGSMLHPNTLSAFMALAIPITATQLALAGRRCAAAWRATAGLDHTGRGNLLRALAAAAAVWAAISALSWVALSFLATSSALPGQARPWYSTDSGAALLAVLAGLPFVLALVLAALRRGLAAAMAGVWVGVLALCLLSDTVALWLTLSRGAMLSLMMALPALLLLWRIPSRRGGAGNTASARSIAVVLSLLALGALGAYVLSARNAMAQTAANAPALPTTAVIEQGINPSWEDFKNPESAALRLSYWRVGFRMAASNPWFGVGLGNFGTAYSRYQYRGAGDVTEAHNGYLQTWCETGIVGAILLSTFCAMLLLGGARELRREPCPWRRLKLAGMWGGCLAFLAHAFADITFSHASLMMMFMVTAGVFWNSLAPVSAAPGGRKGRFLLAAGALLLAASLWTSGRYYGQDLRFSRLNFGHPTNREEFRWHVQYGQAFMQEIWRYGNDRSTKMPRFAWAELRTLIPDQEAFLKVGRLGIPGDGTRPGRELKPGEAVPPNAVAVVLYPWRAAELYRSSAQAWLDAVKAIDDRYPENPDVAQELSELCHLLATQSVHESLRPVFQRFVEQHLYWAREAWRRNPESPEVIVRYANALFFCGFNDPRRDRLADSLEAKDLLKRAADYAPLSPPVGLHYADLLHSIATIYRERGDDRAADAMEAQSKEARARFEAKMREYGG